MKIEDLTESKQAKRDIVLRSYKNSGDGRRLESGGQSSWCEAANNLRMDTEWQDSRIAAW